MKITNLIFDIGCVLADFDWKSYLNGFGFEPEKESAIAAAVFAGPYWQEYDRGVWSLEQLEGAFVSLAPQYEEDVRRVFRGSHLCIHRIPETIPWLKTLKERGFRLYYLSNYSGHMRSKTLDALDFTALMEGGLFSYEVQQLKPDASIFQSFFERFPEVVPEESVFFDDRLENAEGADRVGIHGVCFKDRQQAEEALESLLLS